MTRSSRRPERARALTEPIDPFGGPLPRGRRGDLTTTGNTADQGVVSLREVLVHMVEEYARHNGHADLLRERIDGRTGQ